MKRILQHPIRPLFLVAALVLFAGPGSTTSYAQEERSRTVTVDTAETRGDIVVRFRGRELPKPPRPPAALLRGDTIDVDLPEQAFEVYIDPDMEVKIEEMVRQAEEQHRHAERAQRMEMRRLESEEVKLRMREMKRTVREMTENLRRFPKRELKVYLDNIRDHNGELFGQLREEWKLEAESQHLAQQIRAADDASEREELRRELREVLEEAWELKIENRQQEIDVLEEKLDELREELEESEGRREQIVEERMQVLLNG